MITAVCSTEIPSLLKADPDPISETIVLGSAGGVFVGISMDPGLDLLDDPEIVKCLLLCLFRFDFDLSLVKPVTDRFLELAQVKFK